MKKGFLIVLMVFVFSLLPVNCLEADAAAWGQKEWFCWANGTPSSTLGAQDDITVQVEKGQKFYVGDFAIYSELVETIKDAGWTDHIYRNYTASMVKAKYKSSNKSVATVSSKGYLKTKRKGKTTISISYKGTTLRMNLEVVAKGKLTKSAGIRGELREIHANVFTMPKKITTENGIELCRKMYECNRRYWSYNSREEYINQIGFISNFEWYSIMEYRGKLVAPKLGRFNTLSCMLQQYALKYSPEDPNSPCALEAKEILVDSDEDKVIVKLKKPITKQQYIALLADYIDTHTATSDLEDPDAECYAVYDRTEKNTFYFVSGDVELGSDTIVMEVRGSEWRNGAIWFYDADLIEGHKYQIGKKADWTKGKKVVAKDYPYSIYEEMEE